MELTKPEILDRIKALAEEMGVEVSVTMQNKKADLEDELNRLVSESNKNGQVLVEAPSESEPQVVDAPQVVDGVKDETVDIIFNRDTILYRNNVAIQHKSGSRLRMSKKEYKALRLRFSNSGHVPFDTVNALLMREKRAKDSRKK